MISVLENYVKLIPCIFFSLLHKTKIYFTTQAFFYEIKLTNLLMFRMRNICPNGRHVNVLMLMNEGKYLDCAYFNRYSELCIIHI